MIFYYSGCGNSRWIAEQLAGRLDEKLTFIPELMQGDGREYAISEGESVGFVFPVYSWAAPELVERFVLETKWSGKPRYVWFACTCGDEMGFTRRTFAKTLRRAGLELDACFCFVMPETYLAFPGFRLDTKEREQAKIDDARNKLPWVSGKISLCQQVWDEKIGWLPYTKSYLIRPLFVRMAGDSKYHVLDTCIGCGKCQKVCPLGNVTMVDGRPQWNGNCTQCMACYHYCPQNAIQYGNYTRNKGQYFFRESGVSKE